MQFGFFSRRLHVKTMYKIWYVQSFIYYKKSALGDAAVYRLYPRMIRMAFLRGAFFRSLHLSRSCRKRVLLKHPFDRGRRPFTSLSYGRRVIRVQRAMRGIFDVKVLLPRLVCSASKFQTSCL